MDTYVYTDADCRTGHTVQGLERFLSLLSDETFRLLEEGSSLEGPLGPFQVAIRAGESAERQRIVEYLRQAERLPEEYLRNLPAHELLAAIAGFIATGKKLDPQKDLFRKVCLVEKGRLPGGSPAMIYKGFDDYYDMQEAFEIPEGEAPPPETILYAEYDTDCYEGSVFVLFRDESGDLKEVNGSHCSCCGLEGRWKPVTASLAELLARPALARDFPGALEVLRGMAPEPPGAV